MRLRRVIVGVAAAVVVAAMGIVVAPGVSADQTWVQSIGRPSADAPCPRTSAEDAAKGWTEWDDSWGWWPNHGTGGWVCDRSNTWLRSSGPSASGPGCVQLITSQAGWWVNFGSGTSLAAGSQRYFSNCSLPSQGDTTGSDLVYTTAGHSRAVQLCLQVFSLPLADAIWDDPAVYSCGN